jgi:hypothetical protein
VISGKAAPDRPKAGRLGRNLKFITMVVRAVCEATSPARRASSKGRRHAGHDLVTVVSEHLNGPLYMPVTEGSDLLAGKPPKVAMVACMRKLITILNQTVKTGQHWNPELA